MLRFERIPNARCVVSCTSTAVAAQGRNGSVCTLTGFGSQRGSPVDESLLAIVQSFGRRQERPAGESGAKQHAA